MALGIKDKFFEEEIETAINLLTPHYLEIEETNFEKDLDDWKIIYFHLLKMYELKTTEINDTQKIRLFLKWVVEDCFSTPASTIFALIFFSPKSSSFGTMIKKINSLNLDKLQDGLKNAAWDLTYIIEFRKLSKNQPDNIIWFFCSHDKVLKKIVRNIFLRTEDDIQVALNTLINEFWGKTKGKLVLEYYQKMAASITENDEMRIQRNRNVRANINSMIERKEVEIFSGEDQRQKGYI